MQRLDGILIALGFGKRIEGKIQNHRICPDTQYSILWYMPGTTIRCRRICPKRFRAYVMQPLPRSIQRLKPCDRSDERNKKYNDKGGTMRLGSFDCKIKRILKLLKYTIPILFMKKDTGIDGSLTINILNCSNHMGLKLQASTQDQNWSKSWSSNPSLFIGVQFHLSYRARQKNPHPIFVALSKAAMDYRMKEQNGYDLSLKDSGIS